MFRGIDSMINHIAQMLHKRAVDPFVYGFIADCVFIGAEFRMIHGAFSVCFFFDDSIIIGVD